MDPTIPLMLLGDDDEEGEGEEHPSSSCIDVACCLKSAACCGPLPDPLCLPDFKVAVLPLLSSPFLSLPWSPFLLAAANANCVAVVVVAEVPIPTTNVPAVKIRTTIAARVVLVVVFVHNISTLNTISSIYLRVGHNLIMQFSS